MSKKCLDTRDKILKEAFNEFQKKGYKLANIDAIVKKAGVTKGALYYYFKSKKELANSVIDTVVYNQLDKNFLSFISLDEQRTLPESLIKFSEKISIEEIKNGGTMIRLANELSDNHRGTQNRIKNLLDLMV
ncbi:TetR/AcrR family transcriptional regulator, partial [Patescibacteria group bacterium]|nr:TetR/AcrR family transcriptional regulator [Patescibacteria group bacterium]